MTNPISSKIRAQVSAARKKGGTYASLSKRFDIAEGSVRNILDAEAKTKRAAKKPASAPPVAAPPPPVEAAAQVVEVDPVFARLLETVDGLASAAGAEGDVPALATLARLAATLREHRRKAAPPTDEPEGVYVSQGELDAAAARCRKRWHDRIDAIVREHGPKGPRP